MNRNPTMVRDSRALRRIPCSFDRVLVFCTEVWIWANCTFRRSPRHRLVEDREGAGQHLHQDLAMDAGLEPEEAADAVHAQLAHRRAVELDDHAAQGQG